MKLGHRRGILVAAFGAVNATACATTYVPPAKLGPPRQETAWPAYLGTPRHDAAAAESLNADPRPLSTVDVGRAVRGSPALGETVLAVGTVERVVALVELATGQALWRTRLSGTISGGPLLEGDRLYVATEASPDAKIYALRLRDGQPIWSTRTESVVAPLALEGDTLYAATETGEVLRLETAGGRVTWRRRLPGGGAARAGPVPAAGGRGGAAAGRAPRGCARACRRPRAARGRRGRPGAGGRAAGGAAGGAGGGAGSPGGGGAPGRAPCPVPPPGRRTRRRPS